MRDAEPRVLEKASGSHQTCGGQVALWRRQPCAEESTHERAGDYAGTAGELPHRGHARRRAEEALKKTLTVHRNAEQVLADAGDGDLFDGIAALVADQLPQIAPPFGIAHIDQRVHALLPEGEQRMRGLRLVGGEQRDSGHARKFAHQSSDLWRMLRLVARDRHDDGRHATRA